MSKILLLFYWKSSQQVLILHLKALYNRIIITIFVINPHLLCQKIPIKPRFSLLSALRAHQAQSPLAQIAIWIAAHLACGFQRSFMPPWIT